MTAIQRIDPIEHTVSVIDRLRLAHAEMVTQTKVISDAQKRYAAADSQYTTAFRELHEELRRMDVATAGNYGWEQRVANFLIGVRSAA